MIKLKASIVKSSIAPIFYTDGDICRDIFFFFGAVVVAIRVLIPALWEFVGVVILAEYLTIDWLASTDISDDVAPHDVCLP